MDVIIGGDGQNLGGRSRQGIGIYYVEYGDDKKRIWGIHDSEDCGRAVNRPDQLVLWVWSSNCSGVERWMETH